MALALFDTPFFGGLLKDDLFSQLREPARPQPHFADEINKATGGSYSYSSRSVQWGNEPIVTQCSESFQGADGQTKSRMHRSIGDQVVEETANGEETHRTLTNVNEDELGRFEKQVAQGFGRPFPSISSFGRPFPSISSSDTSYNSLPAALEADLSNIRKA